MTKNLVMNGPVVLVRGAGEQASGVAWTLARAGFRVVMTEVAKPLMVRWPVCFGTAVAEGRCQVEGISACRVEHPKECEVAWQAGEIPILVDPNLEKLPELKPSILIDAILAKRNLGTKRDMAQLTIGLGPGFTAEIDVDVVVETNRGHFLGQLIYSGTAQANTGIPGVIEGFSKERVVYSSQAGVFKAQRNIGEQIMAGDCLGEIEDGMAKEKIFSSIKGVLRGLLRTDTPVEAFVKVGDIDPRGREEYCWTISEKARAIGSAVLLSILSSHLLEPLSLKENL
ncbi:selenium-dependent molybdenum cofactor biosynthesis protein YqeB [Desulfosporosinus sp. BICA1-9]|uniref:selenium-dependent molybdenum cofactor biosynthesis protein YqeB n=1 Tax=Desulfosporosinus sp. BICA1-9 TaxID=1531958 RepID=UPI00054B48EA|nr:selenium-dependent molybdenum cofactor biosynthesis protein YqeB [Desulfosporosinus sp. BICA1-9]KJS46108.1 MAG: NADP-binding protein [Peptococcaceae bacterium BRH_c23]KJS88051.1 MAG: NADP-binding protein [Desulfosporosinus sp. BICA1-9]HBW34608.1 EF2563 family selenium-dependent molybdenum hydroxylase system protein [Desulfosporosinus sp.]